MDPLSLALSGPNARGAFILRSSLDPPWAMRIEDEAPLTVIVPVRGQALLRPDEGEPVLLRAGDIAVVKGPQRYTVADAATTAPQVLIRPGQVCVNLADGPPMSDVGVRTWGNASDGGTLMLNGTYGSQTMVGQRLLAGLPPLITASRGDVPAALVDLLAAQIALDLPGQDAMLERLLDLILIAVLRRWLAERREHGWYRAYADPAIARAMRLMQESPAEPWTVARLGAETGLSRAAFARRFHELVGEPPVTFLTNWRLSVGADLLREPGATVASVARRVGYSTPYAFSSAFKRLHRVSPQEFRARTSA